MPRPGKEPLGVRSAGLRTRRENRYVTPPRPSEDGQIYDMLVCRDHPPEAEGLHQSGTEGGPDGLEHFIGVVRLAADRQVVLEGKVERFERRMDAFGLRVEGQCELMGPDELLTDVSGLGIPQRIEQSVYDVSVHLELHEI